jgi:CxxC-x17-CxxC domain-containing protein
MQDKQLVCRGCGASFLFTIGEQEFHAQKGYSHDPQRCPSCRIQRQTAPPQDSRPPRPEFFEVQCAECQATTRVPFKPTQGRPVYCQACFRTRKG